MSLVKTHWSELSDVLDAALDAPPQERAAIVEAAFPDNPTLREEAFSLLRAATGAPTLLDWDAWQCAGTWVDNAVDEALNASTDDLNPGTTLGAYTIEDLLGTGGSSRVYKARRSDGLFDQTVAIKVLRKSQRINFEQRFLQERSILASLDHPNIARIIDGGATSEGHPYFVMEHVEGTPITTYCDTHRLSIPKRLRLMQQVMEAVQHAHQNLIVHRDLKPSNILVTDDGHVRLLDFGIAKVLEDAHGPMGVEPYETQTGAHPLTPGYAAPEQIEQGAITTRTDVYALGRVCYELICGCRPVDADTTAPYAMMQAVCEGNLRPMHEQFATRNAADRETIAEQRGCTETALKRYLQSDLRAVLSQALACVPDDRYGTAAGFKRDMERYLDDRPVQARTATPWYQIQTFVRRNRWGVLAATLIAGLVLAYAITVTQYSQQMRAERDKSEAVTTFLTDLFTASNPEMNAGTPNLTVREVVDRGAAQLDTNMEQAPQVRADLKTTLGQVYSGLGLYEQGEPLLREALTTRLERDSDQAEEAGTRKALGYLLFRTGDYEEAEAQIQQALELAEQAHGASDAEVGAYLNGLAILYNESGRGDEAEPLLRQALAINESAAAPATYLHNLAIALQDQGKFEEALSVHEDAITAFEEQFGAEYPGRASAMARYAFSLHLNGDYEEAAAMHEEALTLRRDILPEEHPHIASSLIRYGWLEAERGNGTRAEDMVREGMNMLGQFVPETHWEMQAAQGILGIALMRQGRIAEGRARLEPVYNGFYATFGPDDWRTRRAEQVLRQTGGVPDVSETE
ncbi:MAG: serine/threonine-protein kinase [Longimonas sp.]|uniref:protein kinase domain-containing protein n=1 Tax=Longimonas sp. TaxID=2039626 RepID=UPI003976CE8E